MSAWPKTTPSPGRRSLRSRATAAPRYAFCGPNPVPYIAMNMLFLPIAVCRQCGAPGMVIPGHTTSAPGQGQNRSE